MNRSTIEARVPARRFPEARWEAAVADGQEIRQGDVPTGQLGHRDAEDEARAGGREVDLDAAPEAVVLGLGRGVGQAGDEPALVLPGRAVKEAEGRSQVEDRHDLRHGKLAPAQEGRSILQVAAVLADVAADLERWRPKRQLPPAPRGLVANDPGARLFREHGDHAGIVAPADAAERLGSAVFPATSDSRGSG